MEIFEWGHHKYLEVTDNAYVPAKEREEILRYLNSRREGVQIAQDDISDRPEVRIKRRHSPPTIHPVHLAHLQIGYLKQELHRLEGLMSKDEVVSADERVKLSYDHKEHQEVL
jgi:hypothetical protein